MSPRRSPRRASRRIWPNRPTRKPRGVASVAPRPTAPTRVCYDLLVAGDLPESWIPLTNVLEWRERVRLYVSLVNQRTVWCERIHAELYHHGVAVPEGAIRTVTTRAMLADESLGLSSAGRERIAAGYRMIDATDLECSADTHRSARRCVTVTNPGRRARWL